jgi:hypothetical protein
MGTGSATGDDRGRAQTRRLLAAAAVLLGLSGWLWYTLVLGEPYLEYDSNARFEDAVAICVPALAGLVVATVALTRARRR